MLDGGRRRELADWVADGGLVIEDDYDAEHRYDRPPVPALRATIGDRICYAGSVSKILAPALRVGWLLAPPRYVDDLVAVKRDMDLGNPVLAQLVLAALMDSGELERQLRLVRRRHRRRRDVMIAAIERGAAGRPGARSGGRPAPDGHLRPGRRRCGALGRRTGRCRPGRAESRCIRCPGTGTGRAIPGSCWDTPPPAPGEIVDAVTTLGDLVRGRWRG